MVEEEGRPRDADSQAHVRRLMVGELIDLADRIVEGQRLFGRFEV
jgi:hypothetical protein